MSGALEQPMFTVSRHPAYQPERISLPLQIMLQRDTFDVSGNNGAFTIGKLPDGIDNSSLTWVPVRLYDPEDGGLNPPTFAPGEVCFVRPIGIEPADHFLRFILCESK